MRILIFFLIIIFFLKNILYASVQNKILVNVGSNQIITSYELKNRIKTILVLNNKELNQENVNKTKKEALNFLINFKLKKIEILKFNIPTNKKSVSDYIDGISSSYNTDGLGFKKIFLDNNLDYELFLDGIETEFVGNNLFLIHIDKNREMKKRLIKN